jgi:hypothetical protein
MLVEELWPVFVALFDNNIIMIDNLKGQEGLVRL